MTIPAYPLQWPAGWKRTESAKRTRAKFSAGTSTTHQWSDGRTTTWRGKRELTIAEAVSRVREQLAKMGVADNLAAIAATLDAMRAIERHGGAEILNRAFTGFTAIEYQQARPWHVVLGVPAHASTEQVRDAYRRMRASMHPDRGGDPDTFDAIQKAWATFTAERGITA